MKTMARRVKKQDKAKRTKNPAMIRTKFDEEPDGLIFLSEPKSLWRV
jgi:hypothetical protein